MRTCSNRLVLYVILATLTILATAETASAADTASRAAVADKILIGAEKQATWITEGSGQHIVYIFFDPNCPYCHSLFTNLRPWVKEGGLQLRWIPVGMLMPSSKGKAAAILDAKDPLAAFYENENHFSRKNGFGGISEELQPSPTALQALQANLALLQMNGLNAVPTMLFRADNGQVALIQGAPPPKTLGELIRHIR